MAHDPDRATSNNPLAADPEREGRVRERAYLMWEADGKPHGRDVEYWERARERVGMEDSADSGLLPEDPQGSPEGGVESRGEAAAIRDNPGELADRLADQGEVSAAALPKRRGRLRSPKLG